VPRKETDFTDPAIEINGAVTGLGSNLREADLRLLERVKWLLTLFSDDEDSEGGGPGSAGYGSAGYGSAGRGSALGGKMSSLAASSSSIRERIGDDLIPMTSNLGKKLRANTGDESPRSSDFGFMGDADKVGSMLLSVVDFLKEVRKGSLSLSLSLSLALFPSLSLSLTHTLSLSLSLS
jgi:hypothetical protein